MKKLIGNLNQIGYKKIVLLLAISETLHNLEEAILLPEWSKTAGMWHPKVGTVEFRIAILLSTIMIYGIIYYFSKKDNALSNFLMGGAIAMVLFNVLMPHLLATAFMFQYAPGLLSGVLFNVPVTVYLLRRGVKERLYKKKTLALAGLCFALIAFPLLQLFFALGRIIENFCK